MLCNRSTSIACALLAAASCARAHDTWFAPRVSNNPAQVALMLGTGNQFPVHETGVGFEYLVRSGCRSDLRGKPIALQRVGDTPTALWLRVPARKDQPLSCWAQLTPFEVQLAPDKIAIYLKDIQASATVRQAWAGMSARGVPWKERYTKHARIDLAPDDGAALPVDMAMDVLLESPQRPLQQGQTLQFRVLRDGQPTARLRGADAQRAQFVRTVAQDRCTGTGQLRRAAGGSLGVARHRFALERNGARPVGEPLRDAGLRGGARRGRAQYDDDVRATQPFKQGSVRRSTSHQAIAPLSRRS